MKNFNLKFGKYKGMMFLSTPKNYQDWLLSQDWFKVPNELTEVQKEMSQVSKSLKNWNGYSRKGESAYDRIFELEKIESDLMYCNCGKLNEIGRKDCGWDCGF